MLVSSSVNGDIAIQWEWSNFDPSRNQNPLTDYDKTLHNWLRPRDEHVTQNLCQSPVRECLAKHVKYKASLFYCYLYFFPESYWNDLCMDFGAPWLKSMRCDVRKCLFGVHMMSDNILGFKFPTNSQKWPFIGTFELPQTASRRLGGIVVRALDLQLEIAGSIPAAALSSATLDEFSHALSSASEVTTLWCYIKSVFK